jgi:hypothetical protein
MAKTEKVVDLKPELDKITDEQLKGLQEIVNSMNGATTRLGQLDNQKHMVNHDIMLMRTDLQKMQAELEEEYGKVNVNITDGTITPMEDVEADTKD